MFTTFTDGTSSKKRVVVHLHRFLSDGSRGVSVSVSSTDQGLGIKVVAAGIPSGARRKSSTVPRQAAVGGLLAGLVNGCSITVLVSRCSRVCWGVDGTIIIDIHQVISMDDGGDVSIGSRRRSCQRCVGWGHQLLVHALASFPSSASLASKHRHSDGALALAVASAVGTTAYTL